MQILKRVIDRIGLTIINPSKSFDLIIVEGVTTSEGFLVTIMSILMLSLTTTVTSTDIQHPLISFLGSFVVIFILWFLFLWFFSSVVKILYKVPGEFKEFFWGSSYALTTSILPAISSLIFVIVSPVFSLTTFAAFIGISFIWFIWLVILFYMFSQRYFKIDLAQFFAALIVALFAVGVIFVVLVVLVASILFVWWVL